MAVPSIDKIKLVLIGHGVHDLLIDQYANEIQRILDHDPREIAEKLKKEAEEWEIIIAEHEAQKLRMIPPKGPQWPVCKKNKFRKGKHR